MLNEKKISKTGSITIPKHIRTQLGISDNEKVKIDLVNNGDILLTRIIGSCCFCESNENLIKFNDKYICKSCLKKLNDIKDEKENEK